MVETETEYEAVPTSVSASIIPVNAFPSMSYTLKEASSSTSSNQPITKAVELIVETETQFKEYMELYGGILTQHNATDLMAEQGAQIAEQMLEEQVDVLVVVAGREGALPSLVAGLVDIPIIAVPTSIGYGFGEKGTAALAAMLQACPLGLAVAYYVLPLVCRSPLYSHTLSLIGFWSLLVVYTHIGTHHLLQVQMKWVLQQKPLR